MSIWTHSNYSYTHGTCIRQALWIVCHVWGSKMDAKNITLAELLPTDRHREGKSWSTAVYPLVNSSSSLGQFHRHTDSHGQAQRDTNNTKRHECKKEMNRKRKGRPGSMGWGQSEGIVYMYQISKEQIRLIQKVKKIFVYDVNASRCHSNCWKDDLWKLFILKVQDFLNFLFFYISHLFFIAHGTELLRKVCYKYTIYLSVFSPYTIPFSSPSSWLPLHILINSIASTSILHV